MKETKENMVTVPILINEEVVKLAAAMYAEQGSEEKEDAFWEEVYKKRGLHPKQNLINEFDSLVSTGNLHFSFSKGRSIESISDDEKIKIMQLLREIEEGEDRYGPKNELL